MVKNCFFVMMMIVISCNSAANNSNMKNSLIGEADTIKLKLKMDDNYLTVSGIAYNAKLGAIILTNEQATYYIEGLDEWPAGILGKRVSATGLLKSEYYDESELKNEKGEYIQGMSGEKLSLQNAKWEISK